MKKDIAHMVNELNKISYDLLITKNKDYSNDNLIHTGAKGISARLVDKAQRLFNLADKEEINHESIQDNILDLINYTHLLNIEQQGGLAPTTKLAFLSGPIDDVDEYEAQTWRETLGRHLLKLGVSVFDPAKAFKIANGLSAEAVIDINKEAIRRSNLMIANMSGEGRGFGTIREIEFARSLKIPVIIIGDLVSLATHDCILLPDMHSLYEYLGITIPRSNRKDSDEHGENERGTSSKTERITRQQANGH